MERSARERCSSRAAPLHRLLTEIGVIVTAGVVIVITVVTIVQLTQTTCCMLPWPWPTWTLKAFKVDLAMA